MNWLSLKNNQSTFKTFEKITNRFRRIYKIYLQIINKIQKMSTCNQLDLKTLGSNGHFT